MEVSFTEDEIYKAVCDLGSNKFWNILKDDIKGAFKDFLKKVIAIISETYICHIPKKDDAKRVSDFRSISLLAFTKSLLVCSLKD